MKTIICSLIFSLALSVPLPPAFAGAPERVSYQGTLRKSGVIHTGTVPMQFRITSGDGSAVYWTSGSTDVYVSAGLFRYPLGTPNEAQFLSADWANIAPYVEVTIEGTTLPREPLYSTPYSLYSKYSGGARGDLRVSNGEIIISTTSGSKGLRFQDGTLQTTAAIFPWTVSGGDIYATPAGGVGIGAANPAARLDVKAAGSAAADMAQIWRNSAGTVVSSVSATGIIKAAAFIGDGAGLTGITAGISGVTADSGQFSGSGSAGDALTLRSSSVTLQGNAFNGAGQLVRLDGAGALPALNAAALAGLSKTQVGLGSVTDEAQIPKAIGTVKGDILVFTAASEPAALPAGADGLVLMADSSLAAGLKWISPPSAPVASVFGRTGNVTATASDVGLGSVNNTSDADKPVSTAQLAALDLKAAAADVIASTNALQSGLDLKAPLASPAFTGTVTGVTKAMVGLGSADNTSDADKPLSTAQQAALDLKAAAADVIASTNALQSGLDLKAPLASPAFTGTVTGVTKAMVGLANVENEAQIANSLGTTKGDLISFTGSAAPARLAAGSDGQVLSADSAEPAGLKWVSPPSVPVTSVFGRTGDVTASAADIAAGTFQDAAYTFQNAINLPGGGKLDASGNLGIGTASPRSPLDVNGTITGKPAVLNATSVVDFATGNLQYTAGSCGAFSLWNMKDGGSYTFVIKGTSSSTCSFSAYTDSGVTALLVRMPPDNAATTEGQQTLYSMVVLGGDVYLAWVAGY